MMAVGATQLARARTSLGDRLQVRRAEIEQAILTRVYGVSDTSGISDPEYAEGLRVAVSVAVGHGFTAIQHGDERIPPVPTALLLQARKAARLGVSLDTVLRRYFAGYALLGDFLIEEAAKGGLLEEDALKGVLRALASLFDRLLVSVSEEYAREADAQLTTTSAARRAERVQRLLDGELLDTSALGYDFDGHHVGVLAAGPDAFEVVQELNASLDCRSLIVPRSETTVWAWLGARRRLDPSELGRVVVGKRHCVSIAFGEPARGLAGWRLTHRQALAALSIVVRSTEKSVRYADVALLASLLQDDVLKTSLRELYITPLADERDGGESLRETLSAYFAAERNVSSAAAVLGVSRRTVTNRLHAIEAKIDRPLNTSMTDLELALRLEGLDAIPGPPLATAD